MSMYILIPMFMLIIGLVVFSLKRKHMLSMLLSLEFIVVSLFLSMMLMLKFMAYEYFFSMIYLTISVCESSLGLSMLVLMMRICGNDYIMTLSLLW